MLNGKQEAAIDLLAAGRKGVDIEKEVGVSHAQLYRWRQDPEFVARWEDARAQVHEQRAEKLFEVGSRALDVALASLAEGDPIMARDIIKILAPALFDVRYVSQREATPHALHPPVPAGPRVPTRHLCESCDKECGTAGALASHRRTHLT